MKKILDLIGKLFIYESPELRALAGTPSHYSKTIMINMIIDEIKDSNIT